MAIGSRQQDKNTLHCSFCGKSQDVVGKLISTPNDYPRAYICDECVVACNRAMGDLPAPPYPRRAPAPSRRRSASSPANGPACSFCHKGPDIVRLFPSAGDPPKAIICEECLHVCRSIIEDIDLNPAG